MIEFKQTVALALIASAVVTSTAQASLFDRGGGLLYDNVLNVTWLQDANYAKTSGYDADGLMNWTSANTWAANLVYHDGVRNVDYSDWRLASNTPVNGSSFNYDYAFDGSRDSGYNITSPHSELAYMYNVNLALKDSYSTTGNTQPDFGIFGNGTYNGVDTLSSGQNNVGLVNNLQGFAYWSGTEYTPDSNSAWILATALGAQYNIAKSYEIYAWAVRPGDVAAVPVPGAVWLFLSGLMGVLSFNRRKNKTANLIAA